MTSSFIKSNIKLPFDIKQATFVNRGQNGECYLVNGKIVKLTANYNVVDYFTYFYSHVSSAFDYLKKSSFEPYVKLFDYGFLGQITNKRGIDFIAYYYVMEQLSNITEDEMKVFHTLLSHEDRNYYKNYSLLDVKKIIKNLKRGLDIPEKEIILFCDKLQKSKITHPDIHPRNIMKDSSGNFKLIDLDDIHLKTI